MLSWRYETASAVETTPAVADDMVYVGSNDGSVYALDVKSGDFQWRYDLGVQIDSVEAAPGGVLYVGSRDDDIYAIEGSTGRLLWQSLAGEGISSLDPDTGTLQWQQDIGAGMEFSTAAGEGIVYVASQETNPPPGGLQAYQLPSQTIWAIEAASGGLLWREDLNDLKNKIDDTSAAECNFDGPLCQDNQLWWDTPHSFRANQSNLLIIHGWNGSASDRCTMELTAEVRQYYENIIVYSYPSAESIQDNARWLYENLALLLESGTAFDIIGYSEGGLVARAAIEPGPINALQSFGNLHGVKVENLVTIATPHDGLYGVILAGGLRYEAVRQMTPRSELVQVQVTIGRLTNFNDIVLDPDPQQLITRAHCAVEQISGAWWVIDNGSTNGTFVQQGRETQRVNGRVLISDGDVIRILGRLTEAGDPVYWELTFNDPLKTRRIESAPKSAYLE